MAGLVPAIHDYHSASKNVDARVKPGHDDPFAANNRTQLLLFR